jgi:hypothetical protein
VVEQLVEDLRRRTPAVKLLRNRADDGRLEDVGQPAPRDSASETGFWPDASSAARYASMSSRSLRAWFSCASSPGQPLKPPPVVPASTTCGRTRSR